MGDRTDDSGVDGSTRGARPPGSARRTTPLSASRSWVTTVSCALGLAAAVVTLGGIALAAVVSPVFSVFTHALSDLGAAGGPVSTPTTRLLFNGGLVAGAVLGVGFAPALLAGTRNAVEVGGALLFGPTLLAMGLVGVFPVPALWHVPVAVAFFTLLTVALVGYGVGNYLAGDRRRGLATVFAGGTHGLVWLAWLLTGPAVREGLAFTELFGALVFAGWTVATVDDVATRADTVSASP